jgi:hypothetical protein
MSCRTTPNPRTSTAISYPVAKNLCASFEQPTPQRFRIYPIIPGPFHLHKTSLTPHVTTGSQHPLYHTGVPIDVHTTSFRTLHHCSNSWRLMCINTWIYIPALDFGFAASLLKIPLLLVPFSLLLLELEMHAR